VNGLSKNRRRGKNFTGVNPQGYSQDGVTPNPKSKLENAAKKLNTK